MCCEHVLIWLFIEGLFAAAATEVEGFPVKLRLILRRRDVYGHATNWIFRFFFLSGRSGGLASA